MPIEENKENLYPQDSLTEKDNLQSQIATERPFKEC